MQKKIVIIPAYNEADNVLSVVNDININAPEFDYIIINDNSTDNTEEVCQINRLHCISLPINLGIGGAVQTGYRYAYKNGYDIAIQMDGDGQHDAKYLRKLVEPILYSNIDMGVCKINCAFRLS